MSHGSSVTLILPVAFFMNPIRSAAATFAESDILVYQVPGQGFTGAYFFHEGGTPSFQYNVLGNNVFQPGLTDMIFQFTEPVPDGDPPDPANSIISDLLVAKVTGNTYNLSFWSDGSPITSAQFLAPLGLVAPAIVTMPETGGLQNLQPFFPSLSQLYVASDLLDQPIQDPTGIVPNGFNGDGTPFPSDFASDSRAPNGVRFEASMDDIGGPETSAFQIGGTTPPPAGAPPGARPSGLTVFNYNGNVTNKAIVFCEDESDSVNPEAGQSTVDCSRINPQGTGTLSDVLAMTVTGTTLTFSYWSEDPNLTPLQFLQDARVFGPGFDNGETDPMRLANCNTGLQTPVCIFVNESGHPDLAGIFFGNQPNPFFIFQSKSDPVVPEPGALILTLAGFGLFAVRLALKRRLD
jgi:hypothetical protein